ncbi:MAG: sodium:solute symporter family protein [Caldicoprobacterales bacterium]|jgi:SSS family solute:Na+ symporter|nr:sodium:solute symporter family protein [Clostridiales bacterium]
MSLQSIILLSYLAVTIFIGVIAQRKTRTANSFHGAGLGVLMCVAAGTGEWLGGTSTTGISEYGYVFGISGSWYSIANGIGIIIMALLFAKLYRSLDTVTVPGIIEKYIGLNARIVSSILLTFVMIAVGTSQIVAAGTLGVSVFGMDYVTAVLILGTGFIVYTLAGGMTAVGYTNMMHLVFMYGGMILAILLTSRDVGGLSGMQAALPKSYFSFFSVGMPKVSSWLIASILGACTAQAGIQPILAARDVHVARKAAVITAFTVAPFGILTALLGMAAKVKLPGLANAKQALPSLIMEMNPVAGGIIFASILAAVLSTVSPIILAAGTMITKDIYHRLLQPDASDKKVLFVSRITTALSGVLCMVIAIALYDSARILDIVYFAYTLRGSLFVILLLGIYWKKTSQRGAISGMVVTSMIGLIWVSFKALNGSYPIHPEFNETYASVIAALFSTVLFSFLLKNPAIKSKMKSSAL